MVLINCDMGEGFGIWRLGDDAAIMPSIHIANVACGFHGSDFNHMRTTVRLAKRHGVRVGPTLRCRVKTATICVHSDTPGADQVVRILRETLQAEGILSTTTH
jgi:lactam utilization protein B